MVNTCTIRNSSIGCLYISGVGVYMYGNRNLKKSVIVFVFTIKQYPATLRSLVPEINFIWFVSYSCMLSKLATLENRITVELVRKVRLM